MARVCASLLGGCLAFVLVASLGLASGCKSSPVELLFEQPIGSASYSTPALGKKAVVFGADSGNVYFYGRDGRYLSKFQAIKAVVSAPAYDKETDTMVFGSTSYVVYATSGLGKKRWSMATRDRIKGDPLIADGVVYFGSYDDHLYALDLKSSRKKWIFPHREGPVMPGQAEAKPEGATDDAAAARAPKPQPKTGDFAYSKPFLDKGVVYIGNMDGHVYGVSIKDGSLVWDFQTGGAVTSSPWVEDGVLYVGSNDNLLYAISIADKKVLFKHKTGGWVNASPIIREGVLYCGSDDGKLYALDPKTGAQHWAFDTGGEIKSRPAFLRDKVIITSGARQGGVWIVNAADGKLFYSLKREGKIESDPVVEGDKIFITTGDGSFIGLGMPKAG